MSANSPEVESIRHADAHRVRHIQKALQEAPLFLDDVQGCRVQELLAECARRLDELEVEGLVVRYLELPSVGRQRFLDRIGAMAVPATDSEDSTAR